jgi:phosphoglycolate phosphatase-like HAD superfamily hydrolase
MLVSLDIDEVLFPFLVHFLAWVNPQFNLNIRPCDVTDYSFARHLNNDVPLTRSLVDKFYTLDLLQQMTPIYGAVEGVQQLHEAGHRLLCITGRPAKSEQETFIQVKRYFPYIQAIYHTNHFTINPLKKSDFCRHHGVEVHVDDQVEHVNAIINEGISAVHVKTSWACTTPLHPKALVAQNWEQIVAHIQSLNSETK